MNTPPWFAFDGSARRTLRLTDADVDDALPPCVAREAVRQGLVCHARGRVVQPLKPYVRPGGRRDEYRRGRGIAMAGYLGEPFHVLGVKWILGFQANVERGLPRATAVVALNSADDGSLLSLMDGATLSARRTGAVAAVCAEALAAPGHAGHVALLGAGPIAQASLEALLDLGPPWDSAEVRVYDPRRDRAAALAAGFLAAGARARVGAAGSAREAVAGARVVVAATTGAKSYLEDAWVGPGALVVSLSLDDPTPELFLGCKVIVDDFAQCCRERKLIHRLTLAGRFGRDRVHATLGQVVAGDRPGRESSLERILVNPMGMAVLDLAAAHAAYRAAVARGLGRLEPEPEPRPDVPDGFLFRPRVGAGGHDEPTPRTLNPRVAAAPAAAPERR